MAAPSIGRSNTCTTAILPRQRRELLGRPASSASLSQRYHVFRPLLALVFYHKHTPLTTHAVLAGPSLGGVIAAARVALGSLALVHSRLHPRRLLHPTPTRSLYRSTTRETRSDVRRLLPRPRPAATRTHTLYSPPKAKATAEPLRTKKPGARQICTANAHDRPTAPFKIERHGRLR